MENASKALIIAGAVLISILLITVGIVLMNKSSDVSDQAATASNQMSNAMSNKVSSWESLM